MQLKSSLLLVSLACQIILPFMNVHGQNSVERVITDQIRCSITVESSSWSRRKPSYVLIRIENISDKDIAFSASYYFYLKRKAEDAASRDYAHRGDSYWSPAGIVNEQGQLVVVPHALKKPAGQGESVSYRLPNELVQLRKGESKLIKVDLTQFPWNDRILGDWPSGNNFDQVPKGSYLLEFAIRANREEVKSNEVAISLD